MDQDLTRLFEAHVRFEVDRLRDPDAVRAVVEEEVRAAFEALARIPLGALLPLATAQDWVRAVFAALPLHDDPLAEELRWAVRAGHEAVLEAEETLDDLLGGRALDDVLDAAIGLRAVRAEVVRQATESSVYADLVAHVLYHGLKNYLLTENAVVRHVPGASSLVRLGQRAVSSATPNLEAGIDRRILAFVAASVAETVRDSREFLTRLLDDGTLRRIAGEIRSRNGPRPLGELAGLVDQDAPDAVVAAGLSVGAAVLASPVAVLVADAVLEQFWAAHGEEPAADVLAALSVTPDQVVAAASPVAAQLAGAAADAGYLEGLVRRRLRDFYATYAGD